MEIKVGAEVTMVGKVDEIITDVPSGYYRIVLPSGIVVWAHRAEIASAKNPSHPEPESEYALIDGQIAWKNMDGASWETVTEFFLDWTELLNELMPESVVELVRKVEKA